MSRVAENVASDLEEVAYSKAIESVLSVSDINESSIIGRFDQLLEDHTRTNYPRGTGAFSIAANATNATLVFMRANIEELYPELEGMGVEYNMTTVPVYFSITGNITVVVTGSRGTVVNNQDLGRGLYIPVPLVANRIDSLANALGGGRCEFENIVRYELSALAQDRVLRGYGIGSMSGLKGTTQILTEEDVLKAVNLALLLETKSRLRDADPALTSYLEESWEGGYMDLLRTYTGGDVDPADLFLSSYGNPEYDTGLLLSQSLYAIADILVLRWMEFLHVLDLAEGMESLVDAGSLALNEIIDRCLGVDLIQDEMVRWISERMVRSGYPDYGFRYLHYLDPDGYVEIPYRDLTVVNDIDQRYEVQLGGEYPVDFPSLDLLSSELWGEFQEEWRRSTFQLGEMLETFVREVALGISQGAPWQKLSIDMNPEDGSGFLDQLTSGLDLLQSESLVQSVIEGNMDSTGLMDPMSDAFLEFLERKWEEVVEVEKATRSSCAQIAELMIEEVAGEVPHMGDLSKRNLREELMTHFTCTTSWDLQGILKAEFNRAASWRLEAFRDAFSRGSDSRKYPNVLVEIVSGLVADVPGIWESLLGYVDDQVDDIRDCFQLRCDEISMPLPDAPFYGIETGESHLRESLSVETGYLSSIPGDLNGIEIGITYPWEHEMGEAYPNTHRTDLGNVTMAPYTTQWTISIMGEVRLRVSPEGTSDLILGEGFAVERDLGISTEFTVVVNSGWSLTGVDYTPTSTMFGGITKFMEGIWNGIVDALKVVADGITGAFSFFKNMFSALLSYSMEALEHLAHGLEVMVSGLQGLLEGTAGTAMNLIGGFVESVLGVVEFNATIFGISFSVATEAADIALGTAKDVLRITFSFSIMGTTLSISNRLVRLGGGDYDLLVNCTLAEGDWILSIVVDPLMKVFSHFVEIKGLFHGTVLLLYLPEVVQYNTLTVSLGDIPVLGTFLSNIPTPIPGVKAFIDAGFEIQFTAPFVNHPVINEYEQNPEGLDRDNEWIEIYNPTDEVISLNGWSVETAHGNQRLDAISRTSMMPHGRMVYTFHGQALDNGGVSKFPLCECIVLKDPGGNRIDSTPWTTDHHNDGRTWQRSYDGSDRWVFKEGTMGEANGKRAPSSSEMRFIKSVIWDSAVRAFGEAGEIDPSFESLGRIFSRAVELIKERCIEMLASSIVEMRLFVEVSLNDYSGSMGTGFSLSLVITGTCVRETISMIADMVVDALTRITNPLGVTSHVSPVERLAEHIYIRFAIFGRAGLPSMLSAAIDSPEFRLEVVMGVNLACLAAVFGCDIGRSGMEFGIVLSGIPAGMLPRFFAVDMDKTVDIWLVKATLFPA